MSKPRLPDKAERELWHQVAQQFTPLRRKANNLGVKMPDSAGTLLVSAINTEYSTLPHLPKLNSAKSIAPKRVIIPPPPPSPQQVQLAEATRQATHRAGLDKNLRRRLMRGEVTIEARLDLHGMRLEAGRMAVRKFLARVYLQQMRCVLIITGKAQKNNSQDGNVSLYQFNSQTLRSELPHWLAEPDLARQILALAPATPRDGGGGAWYVLLRRHRTEQQD
ncbi:MAG: Smr/MutS family protein [Alphaproteobacteria bacterium]|nr:Smr/MutS family protein [Alphaproteobacteria bacterium]